MGTNDAVTLPIRLMPPISTTPTNTTMTMPEASGGMPNVSSIDCAMVLVWVMLPMPKAARAAKTANPTARTLPNGPLIPRLRYSCGPPRCSPFSSTTRNFEPRKASEYFEAMPTRPVTHIQNRAPGPPRPIAVATPAMLPTPTVAASAVVSAW